MKRLIAALMIFVLAGGLAQAKGNKAEKEEGKVAAGESQTAAPAGRETVTKQGKRAENRAETSVETVERKGPRIEKVDDSTLRFLDEKGQLKKEMKLRKNTRLGHNIEERDEETAYPSPTGEYVAVLHEKAKVISEESYEGVRTVKVYDAKTGAVILERSDIKWGVGFSENGRRMSFLIKKDGSEEDICLFVYDLPARKIVLLLCDYPALGYSKMSPNGKYYAIITVKPYRSAILYDLETGRFVQKEGWFYEPKVFDDGTAELYARDVLVERLSLK